MGSVWLTWETSVRHFVVMRMRIKTRVTLTLPGRTISSRRARICRRWHSLASKPGLLPPVRLLI